MNNKQKEINKFLKLLKSERKTFFISDDNILLNHNNVVTIRYEGEIAGLAGYKKSKKIGKYLNIKESFIVIREEYQGRGLGKKLLLKLLNMFRKRKEGILIASILTKNIPSIKLFNKNGFNTLIKFNNKTIMIYFPKWKFTFPIIKIILIIPLLTYLKIREKNDL